MVQNSVNNPLNNIVRWYTEVAATGNKTVIMLLITFGWNGAHFAEHSV